MRMFVIFCGACCGHGTIKVLMYKFMCPTCLPEHLNLQCIPGRLLIIEYLLLLLLLE